MNGFFFIADLLEVNRRKTLFFFNFVVFKPFQAKIKLNIPIINLRQKCLYRKDIETCKKPKIKEK